MLRRAQAPGLGEATSQTEPSSLQENHPPAPDRIYYRLTEQGRVARLQPIVVNTRRMRTDRTMMLKTRFIFCLFSRLLHFALNRQFLGILRHS